jgi:hypothetical protein
MVRKDSINVRIFELLQSQKHVFSMSSGILQKLHYNAVFALQAHFVCIIMHFLGQMAQLCQPNKLP